MTPPPASHYNVLLNSGSPTSWPDLSSRRHPLDDPVISTSLFPQQKPSNSDDSQATIVVAIARVVGFLADVPHVCVAVFRDSETVHLVRVAWEDEQSWDDAVTAASDAISRHADEPGISLSSIKSILGFSHSESPCIPVCNFTSSEVLLGYPLTLIIDWADGDIQLQSRANLIHPSSLDLLNEQFLAFFNHRFQQPKSSLAVLPTLSPHLSSANERQFGIQPPVGSISDYIRIKARSFPDHHAVRWYPNLSTNNFEYEHITYHQYHLQSNKYAHWLLANGLQQEDRVAVSMNRDVTFHVALIGILKAGGCYVPVDPELPLERRRYIVQDAGARILLTSSHLPDLGAETHVSVDLPEARAQVEASSTSDLFVARPEGLSYLLYTSGTTGNPKGCLLTNYGLSQALWSISEYAAGVRMPDLSKGRYLGVASIAFDVHLAEAFVPLIYGMAAVTAPRSVLFEDLPSYIVSLGITHVGIVPSLIEATMGVMEDTGDDMPLRYIASGGEKMSDAILDKWASHPIIKLGNFYGPSEVTIGCCARYVDSETLKSNIGSSFRNVSSFVVDSELRLLPRGAVGELIVEGPLVGNGYHGRPDLTAKAFVPWTLANNETSRAYRTGDLVRMMADGSLEIAGRIDTQIKLRGVRIEAEGVSSIVRKAASGLDACTILAKHPSIGADQLVTFVSLSEASVVTRKSKSAQVEALSPDLLEDIRGYCDRELASYMRPSHIVRLSWLPLSSNGKLDEKRMRQIFESHDLMGSSGSSASLSERPLSEMEQRILDVLARYTKMDVRHCTSSTSVFECGLDSIAMIPLTKDLNATFGVRLSAPEIMAAPRMAEIAASIESAENKVAVPSASAAFSDSWLEKIREVYPKATVDMVLPALPIQPGVIFRSSGASEMYIQHVIVDCGEFGLAEKLQASWTAVVQENPILRTIFYSGNVLAQVVLATESSTCPWATSASNIETASDFASWFMDKRAPHISREINSNIQDVTPYRVSHFEAPFRSYFVLSIHHALFDGISLSKLVLSAEKHFIGEGSRNECSLTSVIDAIQSLDKSAAEQFWRSQLESFAWPKASFSRSTSSPARKAEATFTKSLSAIKALANQRRVTLQSLFTSTFAMLISRRLYNSDDVVFGTIRSGRLLNIDGIENAPYPVMAVVPCRVDLNASDNILQHVQVVIGETVKFEHIGLADIQNWIRPGQSMFDTLFSVSVEEDHGLTRWTIVESEPPQPDYLLSVEVVLNFERDTIRVRSSWQEADLPADLVEDILSSFESSAEELAQNGSLTPASTASSDRTLFNPTVSRTAQDSNHVPKAPVHVDPEVAQKLRTVVCDFLAVDPAGVQNDTSFISLGLDSIRAIGLAKALKEVDGYQTISAVDIMQNPSIGHLAGRSVGSGDATGGQFSGKSDDRHVFSLDDINSEEAKLSAKDVIRVRPTTTLQAGLLSNTISSDGQLYIHIFPFVLNQNVDPVRLRDSWEKAIHLLDILRTSFRYLEQDAAWVQIIHSDFSAYWSSDTFSDESEYQKKVQDFRQAFNVLATDFLKTPLIRLRLYSPDAPTADSSARLVLILHHAMYDGISIGKLLDLVHEAYNGTQLPETTQFHELIPDLKAQEEQGASFWADKLLPYAPFDRSPLGDEVEVHQRSVALSPSHAALRALCLAQGVTMQTLCQGTFSKWFGSICASNHLIFGRVVSGRTLANAEDVIGPVLNTIPCVVNLPRSSTNAEFLKIIQSNGAEALSWEHASLRSIQRKVGTNSRLWDALFVFQPSSALSQTENILQFDNSITGQGLDVQYPLNVEFHESAEGVTVQAACRSDYMTPDQLDEQLKHLDEMLQQMINYPTKQLGPLEAHGRGQTRFRSTRENDTAHHTSADIDVPLAFKQVVSACLRVSVDFISAQASLASLGIDSITAIQVASKCRSAGFAISAKQIINSRVVADLIRAAQVEETPNPNGQKKVEEVPEGEQAAILALVAPRSVEDIVAASPGIKWLLAGWQASRGTRFQHSFAWHLPQDLDALKLKHAWIALVKRHPILRAAFCQAPDANQPRIVVFGPCFAPETWSEISSPSADIEVPDIMKDQVTSPRSLSACQTRATLLSTPKKQVLIVHLHHAQYDAWSLPIIMEDLRRLYDGENLGLCSDLNDLLVSLPSTETDRKIQQKFWVSHLADPARSPLFPRQTQSLNSEGGLPRTICIFQDVIPDQLALRAKAKSLDVSISALVMASWAQVQAQYTRGEASTFGLWTAARTRPGAETAAVPCMNVLPISVDTPSSATTEEIAVTVESTLRQRNDVIEQSDLLDVHGWIKANHRPLSNVNLNIVHSVRELPTNSDAFFRIIDVPYFVPALSKGQGSDVGPMSLTTVFSDDISIDVILSPNEGPVTIAFDASSAVLGGSEAAVIVESWKKLLIGEGD